MVLRWSALVIVAALVGSVGCGASGEDVGASSDEISVAASHVSRRADGAFTFTAPIAAKVEACKGACVDRDGDGLVDAWENAVLDHLRPAITFDEDEPMMRNEHDKLAVLGRVTPAANGHVVVNLLLLYTRDYGAPNGLCFSASAHDGDVERVALDLELTAGGGAVVRSAFTTGHEGTEDDQSRVWRGGELTKLQSITDATTGEPRWQVFSSQSKHATYASKQHCESARLASWLHRFCINEDCGPDGVADPPRFTRLPKFANAGEPAAHLVDDLTALGFPGELAWGDAKFCGGLAPDADARSKCPPSVKSKLLSDPFAR
jgi:hypothetical protein